MKKNRWKTIVLVIGLALLGLSAAAYYGPTSQPSSARSQTPAVTNKTTAVEVVSVSPQSVGYELVMKNVSKKNINGYSIGFDDGASVTSDLTSTYKPIIAPGEQFTQRLPATTTIIIRHVVFDDDSIDGDAVAAAQLQDRRQGIRAQLQNIINLINKEGSDADVEQLKAKIEQLPEQSRGSVYVSAGMRNAKEDALLALKKLDRNNKGAGLTKLVEESNRRISRIRTKP